MHLALYLNHSMSCWELERLSNYPTGTPYCCNDGVNHPTPPASCSPSWPRAHPSSVRSWSQARSRNHRRAPRTLWPASCPSKLPTVLFHLRIYWALAGSLLTKAGLNATASQVPVAYGAIRWIDLPSLRCSRSSGSVGVPLLLGILVARETQELSRK